MTKLSHADLLTILSVIVSVATALFALLTTLRSRAARNQYDEIKHRAELDETRKRFEAELYQLTRRMTASERRWRDVNHLVISGQKASNSGEIRIDRTVPRLQFLRRAGVAEEDFRIDRKLVFVLIPFHPNFDTLYAKIRDVCNEIGFRCVRGDEEHVTGDLLPHILRLLSRARLVIAVVDGRNPNVFYELGIAHALSKPVLTLAKAAVDVPFDVRSNRILFYPDIEKLGPLLSTELTKLLVATEVPAEQG